MTYPDEVSDEMLMALADGELPEIEAARLIARIASDRGLAARYADFTETRAMVQAAFPSEPVPERLIAAVLDGRGEDERPRIVPFRRRISAASGWGMALAASVLLAVGGFWAGRGMDPQAVVASGPAGVAMELAQTPTGGEVRLQDGSSARVLGSYETDLGLCRLIGQDSARHVACRNVQTGEWFAALTVQSGEDGGFLPASDMAVGLIDRLLDEVQAGPALTPEEEAAALR